MNNTPKNMGEDELLYACLEQLAIVANDAKTLSELYVSNSEKGKNFKPEDVAKIGTMIYKIYAQTRHLDTLNILAGLSMLFVDAAKSKHLVGAMLSVSKSDNTIKLKGFYGPNADDYTDLMLTAEVAEQLRDGLTQGIKMLGANQKIIMPANDLIIN